MRERYGDDFAEAWDAHSAPKPPIGLKPRYIHDEQRKDEIRAAVERYVGAGKRVPPEWIAEFNELVAKGEDAN